MSRKNCALGKNSDQRVGSSSIFMQKFAVAPQNNFPADEAAAINKKDAVQMIDFMLRDARRVTLVNGNDTGFGVFDRAAADVRNLTAPDRRGG